MVVLIQGGLKQHKPNEKDLFDVTLVSDDHVFIGAHKVVLSALSNFFKDLIKVFNLIENNFTYSLYLIFIVSIKTLPKYSLN